MAAHAIPLGMTRHATLQVLPRGGAVAHQEKLLRVVIAGPQRRLGGEAGCDMARRAEHLRVVAVGARGFPRIGGRRVAFEKACRVITARSAGRRRPMTFQTLWSRVAG